MFLSWLWLPPFFSKISNSRLRSQALFLPPPPPQQLSNSPPPPPPRSLLLALFCSHDNIGAGHSNPGTADGQVDNSQPGSTPAVSHSPGSGGTPLHCCGQPSFCPQGARTASSTSVSVLHRPWSRLHEPDILALPGNSEVCPTTCRQHPPPPPPPPPPTCIPQPWSCPLHVKSRHMQAHSHVI